jgi:protein-tyrosine kinase
MSNTETPEQQGEGTAAGNKDNQVVRLIKSIVYNPKKGTMIDESIVKFKYFNSFNYSALTAQGQNINLTVGVTSANPREGKTLIACNLAVSLAMGSQKKTIVVDLNFSKPRIHEIFGIPNESGLAEALHNGAIRVSGTPIEHLFVLNAGLTPLFHEVDENTKGGAIKPLLGLDQLMAFRDVIYSLEQEFDFIIVDLPSLKSEEMPILFTNQLNGLLVVVNSGKTRHEDLDEIFRIVNKNQVLGFVLNQHSNNLR